MPANIEIKARARNFAEIRRRAEALSDTPVDVLPQEDIFFNTPQGRLKLRILAVDRGQLIYYIRPDQEGPKRSDYRISLTTEPENLKCVLELAYGIRGLVAPSRTADAAELRAARPLAVAGIGNPAQFFATLSALGIEARCVAFPDHHRFVPDDFPAGAGAILMTEKDAVKCRAFADSRFWVVPVSARVEPPLAPLVEERLRGRQAA